MCVHIHFIVLQIQSFIDINTKGLLQKIICVLMCYQQMERDLPFILSHIRTAGGQFIHYLVRKTLDIPY